MGAGDQIQNEPTGGGTLFSLGDVLLEKYRIDRVIGQGGMGLVVEAWHLTFDERVAIKFLLPGMADNAEAVGRFEREARALFKIKSEYVCRVMDVAKTDAGVPFMVMEHLDGRDLADLMRQQREFSVADTIDYGLQACSALAEAHVRNIVHRDLKPENLFITTALDGAPRLKLLDFGLSKQQDEPAARERKLTADAQVMGTPQYMAPEQWMSSKDVGPAADQWSLATILFEMLTGRPPFDAASVGQICSKVLNEPAPLVSETRKDAPRGLDAVLSKALEKNPLDRYENVGALAVALSAYATPTAVAHAERTLKMLRQNRSRDADDSQSGIAALGSRPASSDMAATKRKLAREGDSHPRLVTAQSWQHMMVAQARTGPRLAAFGGIAAMAALIIWSIAVLTGDDPADAPVAPVTADPPLATQPAVEPAPESDDAEALASASASAVSKSSNAPKPRATSSGAQPRKSAPASPVPRTKGGKTPVDMYDDR